MKLHEFTESSMRIPLQAFCSIHGAWSKNEGVLAQASDAVGFAAKLDTCLQRSC